MKRVTQNVWVKVLTYLRNPEILSFKLVCRQFYVMLANPFTLRLCLQIEQPKLAADSIRASLALYIAKKSPLSGEQLRGQLTQCMSQVNLLALNLSDLGIHTEEITDMICVALEKHKTYIERLILCNNNLAKSTINPFLSYLEKAGQIKRVDLRSTKLCKQGVERLCAAMCVNRGVRELNLADNMIGSAGAKHIAEMLKRNRGLEKLYLQKTYIGKEGVSHLLEALELNTTLRSLHLEENKVSAKSIRGKSTRLTKIYV